MISQSRFFVFCFSPSHWWCSTLSRTSGSWQHRRTSRYYIFFYYFSLFSRSIVAFLFLFLFLSFFAKSDAAAVVFCFTYTPQLLLHYAYAPQNKRRKKHDRKTEEILNCNLNAGDSTPRRIQRDHRSNASLFLCSIVQFDRFNHFWIVALWIRIEFAKALNDTTIRDQW